MNLGFAGSRAQTVRALELLGAVRCAYTWTREPDADLVALWHETRCDCKHGGPEPHNPRSVSTELTGCPELRTAVAVLQQLDDEQFDVLVVRAGGVRL